MNANLALILQLLVPMRTTKTLRCRDVSYIWRLPWSGLIQKITLLTIPVLRLCGVVLFLITELAVISSSDRRRHSSPFLLSCLQSHTCHWACLHQKDTVDSVVERRLSYVEMQKRRDLTPRLKNPFSSVRQLQLCCLQRLILKSEEAIKKMYSSMMIFSIKIKRSYCIAHDGWSVTG